jgi:hypothetical protein
LPNLTPRLGGYGRLLPALLIAFLLFFQSGPLLRGLDAAAAVVDIGVLSLLLLAILALLAFVSLSHWLLQLIWPVFGHYRKFHFDNNFKSLLPWQKIIFYLSAFFLLLYALVLCLYAVM